MAITEHIAAIELSSSRIAGIVGTQSPDGTLHIRAYAQQDASPFVHKGVVYNIDKAAQAIGAVVERLNEQLGDSTITGVYTAVSGLSLHTQKNAVSRTVEEDTVSQTLVDNICDENLAYPLEDMDILDVAPQEYVIDNMQHIEAVGVAGRHITGQFLNILARTALKKNLEQSFHRAGVDVVDLFIAPIAQAKSVLTEAEMRSGCALVDWGADTTTVSVYKNNLLRFLAVVPLGSSNLTRDITTLHIEESEAEQLKLTYGDAFYEEEDADKPAVCTLADGRTIERALLNDIIAARTDEILDNVWNLIRQSEYADHLLAGIIFTGGGSNLRNIDEAFRKRSKLAKVRIARNIQATATGHDSDLQTDATHCTILALLAAGRDNCIQPKETPAPAPEAPITAGVAASSADLFEHDEELNRQAQQEKDRKLREEEKAKRDKKGKGEPETTGGKNGKGKIGVSRWFEKFTRDLFSDSSMGEGGQ
ncbi:MAG: cell division protein FtsA [Prevotellaceae bacterium]|jgi:cell division protein FtsA|nr:cell division protein FtsA [Prevotellaceae bacterium]